MNVECSCGGAVLDGICSECGFDVGDGESGDYGSVAYSEERVTDVWELLDEADEESNVLAELGGLDARLIPEGATAKEISLAMGGTDDDSWPQLEADDSN